MRIKTTYIDADDCILSHIGNFQDNSPALILKDKATGETICKVSVCVPSSQLAKGEFLLKSYSENKGLFDALNNLGVIEYIRSIRNGFVELHVCKLKP